MKISNTAESKNDGKFQLKVEVDDVVCFTSDIYEWKKLAYEWEKPSVISHVYVDNKESPSIFGELRKLKFWKLSDQE